MSIFSWLSDRRVRARREAREQGYNYAAGMLLRGIPPSIIECSSRRGGHSTEFYIGMQGGPDPQRPQEPAVPARTPRARAG